MKKLLFLIILLLGVYSNALNAQCSFTTNITASGPTLACASISLTAGTTGTFYSWSNGSNSQGITTTVSGTYSVLIVNAVGCSGTAAINVSITPNPTISVSGTSLTCPGVSNTIIASGANTFTWSANAGGGSSNSVVVNPSITTNYTVMGNVGNCFSLLIFALQVDPAPNASITVSNPSVSCNDVTLTAGPTSNYWTQKTSITTSRRYAVGFSIGTKGYIGTGHNGSYLNDFWEYDPSTNAWTQKANFAGSARFGAIGVSVGNKGYVGTGYNGSALSDFWEYDPLTNTWTQKANFSGGVRYIASAVSVGTKLYVGLGYSGSGYLNDFWEYTPSTNTWVQKSNFPGSARYVAAGFTIGTKGYIGMGYNGIYQNDLYEYDPTFNSWSQKANFGGSGRQSPCGFSIGNRGYFVGGYNGGTYYNDVWEYNQSSNVWVQKATSFGGSVRISAVSFVLNGKAYMGTGEIGSASYTNDLWEYTPQVSFLWSTGSTLQAITSSVSGTYSLTATSVLGCSNTSSIIASIFGSPTLSIQGPSITCASSPISLTVSGASSYTWGPNAGNSTNSIVVVTPTASTSYTVSGTNGGCNSIAMINVTVNPIPVLTANASALNVCQGGTLNLFGSGAVSYTWSNGVSNNVPFTPTASNVYSVIGTNSNQCTASASLAVAVNPLPTLVINNGTVCQGQSFILNASGATTYTYSSGSNFVTPSVSTSYSVYGTNSFGCLAQSPAVSSVLVLPSPTVSVNGGAICSGQNFTLSPTGAVTYTYSGGGAIVSPTVTTSYSITGFGFNGCPNAVPAIATITVNPLPSISAPNGTICQGKSFTITPSGAASYTYSSGSNVVSPSSNAFYTIFGTNAQGCVNSNPAIVLITVNPNPTISVNSGTICQGQSFNMVPSGANSYTYSSGSAVVNPNFTTTYTVTGSSLGCLSGNAAVSTVSVLPSPTVTVNSGTICIGQSFTMIPSGASSYTFTGGNAVVSPTINTNYSVTGTGTNGCINAIPALASITVNALPIITALSGSICNGNSYTINPSGASAYVFSSGSAIVSPANTTTYSVSGTSTAGCLSASPAVVTVTVNSIPIIAVNSGTICSGQSFTMIPSGASTYTYSSGSALVTPSINSTYSVTGTSAAGCIGSAAAVSTVVVLASPTVVVPSGTICNGQSFTLSPSGAVTYVYSGGSAIVSPAVNTTYSVTGTGANGCNNQVPALASITVNTLPVISAASGSICNGNSFTISPSGASSYIYSSGSAIVSPATTTTYSVSGTSTAGCLSASPAFVTVNVNALPIITVNSGSICSGRSFTLTPSGASTYTYSGGSAIVTPSVNSTYSVTGTSSLGCIGSAAAVSTVVVLASPTVVVSSGTICNGQSFTLSPSGAVTYVYSGGSAIVSPAVNTTYSVTGTGANGCTNQIPALASITVNTLPVISVTSGSICNGNSFTITPTGAASYIYSSGSAIVSPATTTTYSVSGTSTAGCLSASPALVTVTVNALPIITVNSGSICSGRSFTLTPSGASTYTYSAGSAIVTPSSNSTYSVTGTSSVGCIGSAAAVSTVVVLASPTVVVSSGTICNGQSFTLSPSGAVTYVYSGGSAIVSPAVNTTYSVTGTSANGCTNQVTALATITVNTLPVISATSGSICNGNSFTISPSGASSYIYSSGSAIVSPATTTTYSVSGTSTAGCLSASPALVTVTVNALPIITVNSGSICSGRSFTLIPSGANTYTYSSGSAIVTPTINTSYSVTGTSTAGCVGILSAISNVSVYALPTVSLSGGITCSGDSFTLIPSGASNYTYSGGSNVVNPTVTTSYSVNGTNSVGCVSLPAVATITVNALPIITVNSGTICQGDSFTINPSGASTYTYSTGSNVITPSLVTTFTYSVIGTNSNNCVSSNAAIGQLSVNAIPSIVVPATATICSGNSYTINPSGAATYTYSNGTNIVSPIVTTSYSIAGTSSVGCVGYNTMTISVQPSITVSISGPTAVCAGQSITLTGNGAITYTWSNGVNSSSVTISPSVTSIYTLNAGNGSCIGSATQSVLLYSNPSVNIISSGSVICTNENFTLAALGAGTYTWSNGSSTSSIVLIATVSNSYSIIGLDANGCIGTASITQIVDPCVGINEHGENLQNKVRVFPNPSNGMITVSFGSLQNQSIIEIRNYLGELIYREYANGLNSEINLKDVANGVYILRLITTNRTEMSTKIIKQ